MSGDKSVVGFPGHELGVSHTTKKTNRSGLAGSVTVGLGITDQLVLADVSVIKEEELTDGKAIEVRAPSLT